MVYSKMIPTLGNHNQQVTKDVESVEYIALVHIILYELRLRWCPVPSAIINLHDAIHNHPASATLQLPKILLLLGGAREIQLEILSNLTISSPSGGMSKYICTMSVPYSSPPTVL